MKDPTPGLYDQLIPEDLNQALQTLGVDLVQSEKLDPAESPIYLARHFHDLLRAALEAIPNAKVEERINVCNQLIKVLAEQLSDPNLAQKINPDVLLAIAKKPDQLAKPYFPNRPGIPLGQAGLLVNAKGEHAIGTELSKEIRSCDGVDVLCAFIKWSGLRLILVTSSTPSTRGSRSGS